MYAVILAGGTGTRLWPLSTEEKPKQFHALVSDKTMLQEAFERASFLPAKNIYIATNKKYLHFVEKQLPQISKENILIEPTLRDTATCIGFAAAIINKRDPESVMAVIYADHMVKDKEEFARKLKTAKKIALRDHTLNIVEVEAREPNTNFGYVKIGPEIEKIDGNPIRSFEKFTEKPDLATAKKYVKSGNYLWNTGYYVWRTKDILKKYKKHLPDTYARLIKMQSSTKTIANEYPKCQKISIDYAIMEKLFPNEVRILPAKLGWSDIGTWETLFKELHNSTPNIKKGKIQSVNSEGNLIYNYVKSQKINLLGIKDFAVINTGKNILICPLEQSHDVKKLQK